MKQKIFFAIFLISYLVVCYYHFRWEKYFDEFFTAAYDPYQVSTIEPPSPGDNATVQPNSTHESLSKVTHEDDRFIAYNNGIVRDKNTGLEWIAGADKNTTWHEAKFWVENLTVDGGGWRMPAIEELKTLYQEGVGTHNMTPLLKTAGGYVWSSEIKNGASTALGLLFDNVDEHWGFPSVFDKRGFAVRSRK